MDRKVTHDEMFTGLFGRFCLGSSVGSSAWLKPMASSVRFRSQALQLITESAEGRQEGDERT